MSSRRNRQPAREGSHGGKRHRRGKRNGRKGAGQNQPGNGNPRIEKSIIGGIAQRITRRLRYVENFTLAGTTTVQSRSYALNGLYDPYLGTGGHQPSGFDTWMAMYGFYNVMGCKATMKYANDATGSSQPAMFGMVASTVGNAVSTAGTITYLMEQGRAVFSDIPAGIVNAPVSRALISHWRISDFADGADTRGMSTYWGTSSTNPGSLAYLEVFHGSQAGTATGGFNYSIILDYDVEFWGPLPNANSFAWVCPECGSKSQKGHFCSECATPGPSRDVSEGGVLPGQASHPQEADEKKVAEPPPPGRGWFA